MKTLLIVLVTILSSFTFFAQDPNNDGNLKESEEIEIRLIISEDHSRNILICPIECYLYNRTLHFNFYENLGNTTIIVRGANNNEVRNVDSTDSFLEINMFNFNNGIYSIEIIAENGDIYTGEFQL